MIIGIDGNEANCENKVGVNQYAFELLWALKNIQKEWSKRHNIIVYLKNSPRSDMPKEDFHWKYRVIPGGGIWIIKKLTPALYREKKKPDVFFTPSHYTPLFAPMPLTCTITDLGYLKFSGQFRRYDFWQLKLWTAWSLFTAKKVFAISNTTKADIVRHYPFTSKKVFVTLLGYDKKRFSMKISKTDVRLIKKKYSIVNEYILFIGTLRPSKNIDGLLEAWASVNKNYPRVSLVIAGKKGWLYETIFEKTQKLNLQKSVIFTDFLPEADKPALLKGARSFIMPSFWEGFGIDVVNAMAAGVPVVISNQGSLPEVGGKVAIYVDPYDLESISKGITKILSLNQKDYNKVVKDGLNWVKKFDWEDTARKTLRVLEEVR